MLTLGEESPTWILGLISGFSGGQESFNWHGVVVEFVINWHPGCSTVCRCQQSFHASSISSRHIWSFLPHLFTRH